DDVMVHPLWVYNVWNTFNDVNIAAMTGLVIASELNTRSQYLFEKYWSFNRGYIDKIYDSDFFESTLKAGPPVWEIGAGANMAFRKSVFKETGYFNEYLDVGTAGCNGDSEMWYRILAKGKSITYNPRAITYHEHRKDLKELKKQIFNYMRGYTVAALLQQKMSPAAGYKKEIFRRLPRYYLSLIAKGFPYKKDEFYTTFVEMKGILSGLRYYYKNADRLYHSSTNEYE
ncbi:MAG: glycosyltransferase family 2 protein, partial [Ginsengibacter sp.]